MKKFIYIILAVTVVFSSCTEFLTLEPQDELIREEYWKTEEDVVSVLGTAYARLGDGMTEIYRWAELRGGLLSPDEKRASDNSYEFFNFNVNEYNSMIQWDDLYEVINLANTILEYTPLAKDIDKTFSDEAYNGYLAEAYFLRSISYFYLVKAFRDVPFILQSYSKDDQDFNIEKTSESEIIAHLIDDLVSVETMAFRPDYFDALEDRKGRANINAVYALLADIYLWNNQYDECIEACNKIEGVYLVDGEDYISLYAHEGNSLESIFELQYDFENYETTNNLYDLTSNNSGGDKEYLVSDYLMGLYSSDDLRQYNSEGTVTYNDLVFSIWKYEGNYPFNKESNRINRNYDNYIISDANWIFYRLAEVYLMRAEAYAEKGEPNKALDELNVIRERAGIKPSIETDKDKLLNTILEERAREFVGEGKRWFDIVRIARRDIDERLTLVSKAVITNVDARSRSAVESKIKDMDSWFLPIYYNELLLNSELTQNPFYE